MPSLINGEARYLSRSLADAAKKLLADIGGQNACAISSTLTTRMPM
jgi:hypothetical protein